MCSYISPTSLFPPIELISISSAIVEIPFTSTKLVDGVAQKLNQNDIQDLIREFNPDYLITLLGFETFSYDIEFLDQLKEIFPQLKQIAFGHYPTYFRSEIEKNTSIDYVIQNEPESEIFRMISEENINLNKKTLPEFKTIDINIEGLNFNQYFEPLMPRPLGVIQTARGCPYTCNFCVKSFGGKLNYKPINLIEKEIEDWIKIGNVKSIRIIDDTFTISKNRVKAICELFQKHENIIQWSCLSRIDTLDEQMISQMANSGCKRIYFGIESGSQKILDLLDKGFKIKTAHKVINICKKYKIETVGFFMTGLPQETESDFNETLNFIKKSNLDLAGLGKLKVYPGTPLFEKLKDIIDFSLFPYKNQFKDLNIDKVFLERQKKFNKTFYLSKKIIGVSGLAIKNPKATFETIMSGASETFKSNNPFIPSIEEKQIV